MPSTVDEWNRTLVERSNAVYGPRYDMMYHLDQPIGHIKELPVHELRWYLRRHKQTMEEINKSERSSIDPKSPLGRALTKTNRSGHRR